MKQDYAASLLKQFQGSLEYQSTDRVVTRAQFRAIALQVVEPSSVAAVEQELMRQGRLAYRVARNGLEVGEAQEACGTSHFMLGKMIASVPCVMTHFRL